MNAISRKELLSALEQAVPRRILLDSDEAMHPFECDGLSMYRRLPLMVALPENAAQVRGILRTCDRLGVPVVTRGAGQNSTYYGKAEDLVLSQEYITPVGEIRTVDVPAYATGPNIDQIMMGNEGTFGVLTNVTDDAIGYDTKKGMISELRQPITVEMVIQEINRYADSEFRYADKSDEVAIDAMVRDFGRQEEAKKRYLEGKG